MPILGTVASQFSGKSFSSFESIETITITTNGTTSIEFTSIPQTFTHLQIRGIGRSSSPAGGGAANELHIQFNSDTNSNYSSHELNANGTERQEYAVTSTSGPRFSIGFPRNGNTANAYGMLVSDILDYTNTNKYKVVKTLMGFETNGAGNVGLHSVMWRSTSAITSIKLKSEDNGFIQYSSYALYGIKGA